MSKWNSHNKYNSISTHFLTWKHSHVVRAIVQCACPVLIHTVVHPSLLKCGFRRPEEVLVYRSKIILKAITVGWPDAVRLTEPELSKDMYSLLIWIVKIIYKRKIKRSSAAGIFRLFLTMAWSLTEKRSWSFSKGRLLSSTIKRGQLPLDLFKAKQVFLILTVQYCI